LGEAVLREWMRGIEIYAVSSPSGVHFKSAMHKAQSLATPLKRILTQCIGLSTRRNSGILEEI
jgi:hypothetical protein